MNSTAFDQRRKTIGGLKSWLYQDFRAFGLELSSPRQWNNLHSPYGEPRRSAFQANVRPK